MSYTPPPLVIREMTAQDEEDLADWQAEQQQKYQNQLDFLYENNRGRYNDIMAGIED